MKKTLSLTLASCLLFGASQARTWTSADGSKTFEGDFVSATNDSVTVKRGLKRLTFKLDLLSEEDRKWVAAEAKKAAAEKKNAAAAEAFVESDFGKALQKTRRLEGKRFKKEPIASPPEYFLLYFSASW